MSILRKASEGTKTIKLVEDDDDYIVVRADISKREFNALAAAMPNNGQGGELTIPEAVVFTKFLFETLVVGWSLDDTKPTGEAYDELSAEGATAVDAILAAHFESLLPTSAEGKQPST